MQWLSSQQGASLVARCLAAPDFFVTLSLSLSFSLGASLAIVVCEEFVIAGRFAPVECCEPAQAAFFPGAGPSSAIKALSEASARRKKDNCIKGHALRRTRKVNKAKRRARALSIIIILLACRLQQTVEQQTVSGRPQAKRPQLAKRIVEQRAHTMALSSKNACVCHLGPQMGQRDHT